MGCSDWQLQPPTGYDYDGGVVGVVTAGDGGDRVDTGCGASDQHCCTSGPACNPGLDCYRAGNVCAMFRCTAAGTQCPTTGHCCDGTSCVQGHSGLSYCCLGVDQPCDSATPNVCCGTMTCTNATTGQYRCN